MINTEVTYNDTTATIETNAHGGNKVYIAEITGTHPKFKLDRDFEQRRDLMTTKTNTYRDFEWVVSLKEGNVYEYKNMGATSSGGESGFWQVQDGELVDISYADAVEAAKRMEVVHA